MSFESDFKKFAAILKRRRELSGGSVACETCESNPGWVDDSLTAAWALCPDCDNPDQTTSPDGRWSLIEDQTAMPGTLRLLWPRRQDSGSFTVINAPITVPPFCEYVVEDRFGMLWGRGHAHFSQTTILPTTKSGMTVYLSLVFGRP
jgi:hypothetical protein